MFFPPAPPAESRFRFLLERKKKGKQKKVFP